MAEMLVEVEQRVDLGLGQACRDIRVGLQPVAVAAAFLPGRHRVALDIDIGVLAADALLGEGEEELLRMHQPAELVEIFLHGIAVDDQFLDNPGHALQREIEGDGGVRSEHALDRRMRDVTLVPQGDILQRRGHRRAHDPGEAGQVFGQHRLRLCGIADEPFCPAEKNSSASRSSVRCRWRISVARRSTELAITPSVAKNMAWRSRGITCVDTGSGTSPSSPRHASPRPGRDGRRCRRHLKWRRWQSLRARDEAARGSG